MPKLRLYTSYGVRHTAIHNLSEINQSIGAGPLLSVYYESNNTVRNHSFFINGTVDFGDRSVLNLLGTYALFVSDRVGISHNDSFNRGIDIDSGRQLFQFSAMFKHEFNDDNSLKIGIRQALNTVDTDNLATLNLVQTDHQKIQSDTPVFIASTDYQNKNKLGKTNVGVRFHGTGVDSKNQSFKLSSVVNAPFKYAEKVFTSYINHSFFLSKNRSLRLGLSSESSYIDYDFRREDQQYKDNKNYIDLNYNVNYSWTSNSWDNNIFFKKQISRPNYSYLNPFQKVGENIIYESGDTEIVPSKIFSLVYQSLKSQWMYGVFVGLMKDYISSFYDLDNGKINTTYKNFGNMYIAGTGVEYNNSFFNRKWVTKVHAMLQYVRLKDSEYDSVLSKSTPIFFFSTNNVINLWKDYKLNVNYEINPRYKDGLLIHYTSQRLDLTLSKKVNTNLSLMVFAHDIFKTDRSWMSTTVSHYFYEDRAYKDARSFGITLKWNFTGRHYKNVKIENDKDDVIDRLE